MEAIFPLDHPITQANDPTQSGNGSGPITNPVSNHSSSHPQTSKSSFLAATEVPAQPTYQHPPPPYSPTKRELESHPIRQRLSVHGDDIVSGLGRGASPADFEDQGIGSLLLPVARELGIGEREVMADNQIKEGESVAFGWGGDKKGGTVKEVATEGSVTMETARGNTAEKQAGHNDPALYIERAGHDVVKNASEVQKEESGETHNEGGVQKSANEANERKQNHSDNKKGEAEPQTGEKRSAEHVDPPNANGEEPKKKKGRPAKGASTGSKKEGKKRAPKRAATESGEPRRSGRVAKKS